ncbi:hypothetical protein QR680_008077 [Steinernema hermaphroditum]|uniref:Uncharacterized protein n=1 Tax=Steinernema hermaphroditum TaxID=289476 RepID=A0AA39IFA1_9BILA|nr:hypothetical protein QR680_008077 [Steinernema hermaphroditum]
MAEQPNVALDVDEIGQRYDEQGHPVPSTVLDAQGNPFRTYELDEYGGYYDEHMFYCDAQGNIWDPSGQLYQATEVAAEQELVQDAVLQQEQVPEQQYHEVVPEQQQRHDLVSEIQYYFDEDSQAYYYFDQDGQPHWYEEPVQQDHSTQVQYYEETGQQYQVAQDQHYVDAAQHEHIIEAQCHEAAEQPAYEQVHDTFGITEFMKQVSLEEPATSTSTQAEKKKLTRGEKEFLLDKHSHELNHLGPNTRRLREEELGIKRVKKPKTLFYHNVTFIATPAGDNYVYPYFLRSRYPGFVRDIEEIEGSYDPNLWTTNPPKKLSERNPNLKYPKPYVGLHPKDKKKKKDKN